MSRGSIVCVFVAAALVCVPAGASVRSGAAGFPRYDRVFVLIEENHYFDRVIGNRAAPIISALAAGYGLATRYGGVGDPSEPNSLRCSVAARSVSRATIRTSFLDRRLISRT